MSVQCRKNQRKGDIKLFFDCERPRMQQQARFRPDIEVIRYLPEIDVGNEQSRRDGLGPQTLKIARQQKKGHVEKQRRQHDKKSWQNPSRATFIKPEYRELPGREVLIDNPGYQITGYDKKDVNANIAARNKWQLQMVQNDGENGDRAQSVNVRTVLN